MDPGDPLPFDNVHPNVPRQKNKRRSSILKPSGTRPVLQDLNPNVRPDPPIVSYNVEKRKSRRVSFSRTQQVKEFQPGQNNLTVWNDTYEEEKSNASSNSTGVNATHATTNSNTTTGQPNPRFEQLQAGQLASVSPSKALPLNIAIPHQASPNKYLPSQTVDTGDFLQSLGQDRPAVDSSDFLKSLGAERDRRDSEDSNVDHESSFVRMLNKISDVAPASQTVVGEVDMSATMMDVSMFQHGDNEEEEDPEDNTAKVDTLGFLAGLAGSPVMDKTSVGGGMDITVGCNSSNRVQGLEHILAEREEAMDITMAPSRTCLGLAPNKTIMGGGMDVTLAPNKTVMGGGMDETISSNKTVMGGGMDVTLAPNKTVMGGGMDVTLASNKTLVGGGMDITLVKGFKTGASDRTVLDKSYGMEMTMAPDDELDASQDSVFENSMLAEYKASLAAQGVEARPNTADLIASLSSHHHPTTDELPDSLPASANSSLDYGATATVKFSVLALANNTLLLPRKESEEDDDDGMTKCPVQFFSYDPSKPVMEHGENTKTEQGVPHLNRTSSGDADMEMTEAVPGNLAVRDGTDQKEQESRFTEQAFVHGQGQEKAPLVLINPHITSTHEEHTRDQSENMEMTQAAAKTGASFVAPAEMEMTQAVSHPSVQAIYFHETSSLSLFSPVGGAASSGSSFVNSVDSSVPSSLVTSNTDLPETANTAMDITRPGDNMDITRPGDNMDITHPGEKSLPRIEVEEPESTDDSGWETIHNTLNIPSSTQPSSTPPIVSGAVRMKTQGEVLREKFPSPISEDPSPDRTEMVGMMPKFNESVWDGDVTSFFPRGESTRAINFPIPAISKKISSTLCQESSPLVPQVLKKTPALEMGDVTSFFPRGESTRAINFPIPTIDIDNKVPTLIQESSPLSSKKISALEVGDVTSFFPRGESTRAINFPIPPIAKKLPTLLQESSPLSSKKTSLEVGDVTSFFPPGESTRAINFPINSIKPPTILTSPRTASSEEVDMILLERQQIPVESQPIQSEKEHITYQSSEQLPIAHTTITNNSSIAKTAVAPVPHSVSIQLDITTPYEDQQRCGGSDQELQVQQQELDVTTPEMQQERDQFWTASGQELSLCDPVHSILPAVEITAAPGECGCHGIDGVGYQHVDCKEHDNRSPQVKRGVEEQCGDLQGTETKKQRMSIEPECSVTRSDIDRDLEGSYVKKDVSKSGVSRSNHTTESLSFSMSVKDRLKNLSTASTSLTSSETSTNTAENTSSQDRLGICRDTSKNVIDTNKETSSEQANSTAELDISDSCDSSPVPALPSLSFRDLSQRLVQDTVRTSEKNLPQAETEERFDIAETSDNVQEMTPGMFDLTEVKQPLPPTSIVYSDEKMIHDEDEPSFLINVTDSSQAGQELAQSLLTSFLEPVASNTDKCDLISNNSVAKHADNEEIMVSKEEVKFLSFNYEMISKPTNNKACNFSSPSSVSMSSIETLQNSNEPLEKQVETSIRGSSFQEQDGIENKEISVPQVSSNKTGMDYQERQSESVTINPAGQSGKLSQEANQIKEVPLAMELFQSVAALTSLKYVMESGEVKETSSQEAMEIAGHKAPEAVGEDIIEMKIPERSSTDGWSEADTEQVVTGEEKVTRAISELPLTSRSTNFSQEELTIFSDLASRQVSSDSNDPSRWRLASHCSQSNTAVFSWLENSMVLVLHLGEKLKPKKSRKSLGRPVGHWAVTKLYLTSVHRDQTCQTSVTSDPIDQVFDAAHFSVMRKFPESALRSQCPNTYSLSSLLKSISAYVSPAHSFFKALNQVRHNFYPFSVSNNLVTVGFVSTSLGQAFDIQVDFSSGFGSAPSTFNIVTTIGPVNKEVVTKLVSGVNPGPEYIKEVASRVEQYLGEKERRLCQK